MSHTSEEGNKLKNIYKPLIYINAKKTLKFDQIISKTINEVGDIQVQDSINNSGKISTLIDIIMSAVPFAPLAVYLFRFLLEQYEDDVRKQRDENEFLTDSNTLTKFLEKIDISDWIDFTEQFSFASIPEELDFPPGHPLPNHFYRVHPLKKKKNRYIPVEIFDYLLYKERESELIKILVDLGATDIYIQELSSSTTQGSAEAKASLIGAGGVTGEIGGKNEESSLADRLMKLNPKNWTSETFKSDEYSWLPYEPDWESLVHARIKGGCVSSSVELTSDTSFSISAQLGLTEGLLENLGSLDGRGEFSRLRKEKKRFEVKFIDV
ncbi:MAG: hypothetical protein AB4372_13875 [Xenococcus sp. (in: cyanobacteria)]